jgi:hypothetical protein
VKSANGKLVDPDDVLQTLWDRARDFYTIYRESGIRFLEQK